jgi:DNA-binding MarR family transcriptional regulator
MIRYSNQKRRTLLQGIGALVQSYQDATDEVDEAVAARLRLNRTDLRCLSVLSRTGGSSASALADATGLTRGAMTTALDRLEHAGYARRVWDQQDRRSVRVELTDRARKEIWDLYGPLAQEGGKMLQGYSTPELEAVRRYLEEGVTLQRAHAGTIRQLASARRPASRVPRRRKSR